MWTEESTTEAFGLGESIEACGFDDSLAESSSIRSVISEIEKEIARVRVRAREARCTVSNMDPASVSSNPIVRLLNSSKALVVLATLAGAFIAFFIGRITWDQCDSMLRWVIPVWLGAQGLEDAAKQYALSKNTTTASLVTDTISRVLKDSLSPPANVTTNVLNVPAQPAPPKIDETTQAPPR